MPGLESSSKSELPTSLRLLSNRTLPVMVTPASMCRPESPLPVELKVTPCLMASRPPLGFPASGPARFTCTVPADAAVTFSPPLMVRLPPKSVLPKMLSVALEFCRLACTCPEMVVLPGMALIETSDCPEVWLMVRLPEMLRPVTCTSLMPVPRLRIRPLTVESRIDWLVAVLVP